MPERYPGEPSSELSPVRSAPQVGLQAGGVLQGYALAARLRGGLHSQRSGHLCERLVAGEWTLFVGRFLLRVRRTAQQAVVLLIAGTHEQQQQKRQQQQQQPSQASRQLDSTTCLWRFRSCENRSVCGGFADTDSEIRAPATATKTLLTTVTTLSTAVCIKFVKFR